MPTGASLRGEEDHVLLVDEQEEPGPPIDTEGHAALGGRPGSVDSSTTASQRGLAAGDVELQQRQSHAVDARDTPATAPAGTPLPRVRSARGGGTGRPWRWVERAWTR